MGSEKGGSCFLIRRAGDLHLAGNRKPKFFYGYVVVVAAFLILVVMWGTSYSFGVFFKPLLTEFGWTRAMTSGAFSLSLILMGLLSIVTGRLNDRFGPRIVTAACGFILGLGYLLMSQISAIWQLYLFYGVIIAVGVSGGFVPLLSTVSKWFVTRRGTMTGIVVSGVGVGTMVMPPLAGWFISTYGWRTSYITIGIIALVLIVLAAQFLRRDPSQIGLAPYGENEVRQESPASEARGFSLTGAIHTSQFWIVCALYFCFGIAELIIMVHIVPHAIDLGISPIIAANILAVIGGVSIAGRIIMGITSDRIGSKLTFIISFVLMSAALSWLVVAGEVWMLFLVAVVFGFGYGGMAVLMAPIIAELFGLSSHGAILGSLEFAFTIGAAVGPLLAGHTFDITGSYQLAFLGCAILGVIGIILASLLRPISSRGGENESKRST